MVQFQKAGDKILVEESKEKIFVKHLKKGEFTEDVTRMMPFVRGSVVNQLGQSTANNQQPRRRLGSDNSVSDDSDDDNIIIIKKKPAEEYQ